MKRGFKVPTEDDLKRMLLELPSEEDLDALPVRSLAAYAARCARRVQSLFVPPLGGEQLKNALDLTERAIKTTERFAAGEETVSSVDAREIADETIEVVGRSGATDAVLSAGLTAVNAIATVGYDEYGRSNDVACCASLSARRADSASGFAARADYRKLLELVGTSSDKTGNPIDPSESGPLGPLWPEGLRNPFDEEGSS